MRIALLISTYNWPEALDLVLKSAFEQTTYPDEILIADDGSKKETKEIIDFYTQKTTIPIKHIWQEDLGFRKSAIINKTIAASNSDYIIEIDGDCIMNKYFIADHISLAGENIFLFGSRVNIQKNRLSYLFKTKNININFFSIGIKKRSRTLRIPLFSSFFKNSNQLSKKFRGCNFSFYKKDFIAVNGYNEDFEGWGKEDSELAIRLLNSGCIGKRIRYKGIVYHIWHHEKSRNQLSKNEGIQQQVLDGDISICKNGIDKYLKK